MKAGEKHYHPHCSRCAKCGDMFGEGEEMYLQGSEIWHPHCSEEFQRENEELERATAGNQTPPSPSPSQLRVKMHISPNTNHYVQSHSPTNTSPPYQNGFSSTNTPYHGKQHSNSSGGSTEPQYTQTADHTWKPLSNNTSSNKPPGFRSIKPPEVAVVNNKPPSPDISDEDDAPPPVPPPPSRSSSSAWKQKYSHPPSVSFLILPTDVQNLKNEVENILWFLLVPF